MKRQPLVNKNMISVIWHIHQPLFIPDDELIRQTHESYRLILHVHEELLVPFTLNVTGVLLKRLLSLQPDLIETIIRLKKKQLLDFTGSGYYHPLIPLLSQEYATLQIKKDLELKRHIFQSKPSGFWPTDLGWAPWMGPLLHDLGFSWVVIDSPSLTLGNALPQWSEVNHEGLVTLSPEIESISLDQELHRAYIHEINNRDIKVFIRDHNLSLGLTDFDKGVIYNQDKINDFAQKIKNTTGPERLVTIAEDGERINAQTIRNYRLFLITLQQQQITFTTPSAFLGLNFRLQHRYFPASTFQYDLNPWLSTMDDQVYFAYLKRVEEKIQLLEIKSIQASSKSVKKCLAEAKESLLKSQDSGCVFWKFHQRTRIPGWEYAIQALEWANKGIIIRK